MEIENQKALWQTLWLWVWTGIERKNKTSKTHQNKSNKEKQIKCVVSKQYHINYIIILLAHFLYFWGFWTSRWGNVLDLYPFTKIWWDFFWWLENMENSGLDMTWLRCCIIELKWQSLELMHCLWGVKMKWIWDLSWRQMCVLVAQSCLTLQPQEL